MMLSLAGCATAHHPASVTEIQDIRTNGLYHTVRSGETVWQIAKLYDIDAEALISANSLSSARALEKGQVLAIPRVKKERPIVRNYAPRDSFVWPVKGGIISAFGSKVDKARNKGIDISSVDGADVRASRSGTVVFCDERLKGFGKTVILDHGDNYQTVYAYNSQILVRVGDMIQRSDVIARVGRTGRAKEPSLHFEIRKNGESRDPFYYLPQ